MFTWTPWPQWVQTVATITVYFLLWYGLGTLNGYYLGKWKAYRDAQKIVRRALEALAAAEKITGAWNGLRVDHQSVTIEMSPAVLEACHNLDLEAFHAAIEEAAGTEIMGADQMEEPTMHMMRSTHPAFSAEEKEWSNAWLARKGFRRTEQGNWGLLRPDPPEESDTPTIN